MQRSAEIYSLKTIFSLFRNTFPILYILQPTLQLKAKPIISAVLPLQRMCPMPQDCSCTNTTVRREQIMGSQAGCGKGHCVLLSAVTLRDTLTPIPELTILSM